MMEEKFVRRYARAVSHKLICSKATRFQLLDGLQQELSAYSAIGTYTLCGTFICEESRSAVINDNKYATFSYGYSGSSSHTGSSVKCKCTFYYDLYHHHNL